MLSRSAFREILERRVLVMDGAMGTLLMEKGLRPGEPPEALLLRAIGGVVSSHRAYRDAGADIVLTCTFGASPLKLAEFSLQDHTEEINRLAVKAAREGAGDKVLVGGCIGPSGRFIRPIGDLGFLEALDNFRRQARALADAGVDLMVLETFSDIREAKAALMAARECFEGAVVAHMTFQESSRTVTGTDPAAAACILGALGADAVGANCSTGPAEMLPVLAGMAAATRLALSAEPNAGMPELRDGTTVYPGTPEQAAAMVPRFIEAGAALIGSCCGSTPEYTRAIVAAASGMRPVKRDLPRRVRVASRTAMVVIGDPDAPAPIVGERINPTSRQQFRKELLSRNMRTVRAEAARQVAEGATLVDINVGVEGVDQRPLMAEAVAAVQAAVQAPVLLDAQDPAVLEAGLVEVEGRPILNSVSAEPGSLDRILPLAARYGAAVIGLTLDQRGIPETAHERLALASRILDACRSHGLTEEDLLIDCLVPAVAVEPRMIRETIQAVGLVKAKLGVATVLGVSNVSHGLPARPGLNAAFLGVALSHGLDLPIVNPYSRDTMDVVAGVDLLLGRDNGAARYLKRFRGAARSDAPETPPGEVTPPEDAGSRLRGAILDGDRQGVPEPVRELLGRGEPPLRIADTILLPAMEEVGRRFEKREFFLPQVILSAEAMQEAMGLVQSALKEAGSYQSKGTIVLATVEGDIHDIGKNILGAVLRSNGFEVADLGKSVTFATILQAVRDAAPAVLGLSALMTTTMPQMRTVIEGLRAQGIALPVIVGGAAVTRRYADEIGAQGYARNAVEAVSVVKTLVEARSRS